MVQIQPVNIWVNGQQEQGSLLYAQVVNDNLKDTAIFLWVIYQSGIDIDSHGSQLASGQLTMTGADYINWNTETDINAAAYTWIADQLSLTIIS